MPYQAVLDNRGDSGSDARDATIGSDDALWYAELTAKRIPRVAP